MVDKGNNSFNIVGLSNNDILRNCLLAKPIDIHKHKVLQFYYTKRKKSKPQSFNYIIEPKIDTLIYKFNSFVEYNARPRYYAIKSIHLRITGCFGECETFELDIKSNGESVYNAIAFNPVKGIFHGKLANNKLKEIKDLIAYLNVKKLEDNYAVSWTDDQTAILKITFEDGSTKSINDYGIKGSMGLKCLYNILFNLRASKIWHK